MKGKYYGTLKSELKRIQSHDHVPVLDIDVKGALHIQGNTPKYAEHLCTSLHL